LLADSQGTIAPAEVLDVAELPAGGQLHLMRWGTEYYIQHGREELMGSEVPQSERALASLVCQRIDRERCSMLIGGLGMGFTLGAALAELGPKATVVVAELVPQVVTWARGPLAHIFGDSLSDPRLVLEVADVHDVIVRAPAAFDAILLDVDNGPDGVIQLANDRLYCNWGLRAAYAALRPGGVLAVWSSYPDAAFCDRLAAAGFAVEEIVMATDAYDEEVRHIIWLASKHS
jgi:spermidine synthase